MQPSPGRAPKKKKRKKKHRKRRHVQTQIDGKPTRSVYTPSRRRVIIDGGRAKESSAGCHQKLKVTTYGNYPGTRVYSGFTWCRIHMGVVELKQAITLTTCSINTRYQHNHKKNTNVELVHVI
jgi:hypothetical protein